MKTYKLVRQMKDGQLAPLFIEASRRLPVGEYLRALCTPTKGFAVRPGFHSTPLPDAPHLSQKGRVWVECEVPGIQFTKEEDPHLFTGRNGMEVVPIGGWYFWNRPAAQGGRWVISEYLKIVRILDDHEVERIRARLLRNLELASA